MTTAVPILAVADVDRSVSWWRRLGFAERFRHQFEPGLRRFVGIRRDEANIYLSEHRGDAPGPALIYLWVDDVDAVAAEFGASIDRMPWGRDCEIRDPDGNRVRVGTPSRDED
jgi:catechol 2,3-dioxygenase-like lactoylglutathione lyase family enzyme